MQAADIRRTFRFAQT